MRFDGGVDSTLQYVASLEALDTAQQKIVMSTLGLSEAQQKQVLDMIAAASAAEKYTIATIAEMSGVKAARIIEATHAESISKVTEEMWKEIVTSEILKDAEKQAIIQALAQTAANEGEATSFDTLAASIKAAGAAMITNPLGWISLAIMVIPMAIKGITALYDVIVTTAEEAYEAAQEHIDAYNDLQNEIAECNDELETNKERIQELQTLSNSGTITLIEQEELAKLKEANAELASTIALKEKAAEQEAENINEGLEEAFTKLQYTNSDIWGEDGQNTGVRDTLTSQKEAILEELEAYGDLLDQYSIYGDNLDLYDGPVTQEDIDKALLLTEQLDEIQRILDFNTASFEEYVQALITKYNDFNDLKASGTEFTEDELADYENTYNKLVELGNTLYDDYISQYFGEDEVTDGWNEIYDAIKRATVPAEYFIEKLSKLPDECQETLERLGSTAELTADDVEALAEEFPELSALLEDGAYSAENFAAHYNAAMEEVAAASEEVSQFTASLSEMLEMLDDAEDKTGDISDAFGEFEENGYTAASTLNDMAESFGDLSSFSDFVDTLSDSDSTIEEVQAACNLLAEEYLETTQILEGLTEETAKVTEEQLSQLGVTNAEYLVQAKLYGWYVALKDELVGLTEANKDYYIAKLESIGVQEAEELVSYALADAYYADLAAAQGLTDATWDEIEAFLNEQGAAEDVIDAIYALRVEEYNAAMTATDFANATSDEIDSLIKLAQSAGLAASKINLLNNIQTAKTMSWSDAKNTGMSATEYEYYKDLTDSEIQKMLSINTSTLSGYSVSYTPKVSVSSSYTPSSSSSSSSSSSTEDEFEETIDWVETLIARIEEGIERIKTVASSAYKTLTQRNSALSQEISAITDEITAQQNAYSRYMQQANAVGLSETYASKVRNGTLDIETITDEDLKDKIDAYQEWYEKAIACSDAITELKETISDLYVEAFDNIVDDYENQLSLLEHQTNSLNNSISDVEEHGYLLSTKYYEALQKVEKQNITVMEKELASLQAQLAAALDSGEITEYSEAWYEMNQEINSVAESIQEATTSLVEYSNAIRDLEWEYFDYLQDRISQITSEADFLINLLESKDLYQDKGQLTDYGLATMGLHGQNYNVYMSQADQYAQEYQELLKELSEDPYNTDLIERKEELLSLQQEMILAAEDEKQAIVDMVEEGIELELSALKELIDTYTDALDAQKDLYDYQKKTTGYTAEIASLQKQLSAYAGDTSEETRAKIQQLTVDLKEAQENLEESEYDQYISDQKKLLDELYDEYEAILNARLDDIDALMSDMIAMINEGASAISDTLYTVADSVGYTMTDEMQNIWDASTTSITSVIAKYGDDFSSKITTVSSTLGNIYTAVQSMISASDTTAAEDVSTVASTTTSTSTASSSTTNANSTTSTTASTSSDSSSSSSSWGSWFVSKADSYPKSKLNVNSSIVDRLKYFNFDSSFSKRRDYYTAMGGTGTYTGSASQNVWMESTSTLNTLNCGNTPTTLMRYNVA